MSLVTTTEMFKKAMEGKYAIGAFNINNMEFVQAIMDAAAKKILQLFYKHHHLLLNMLEFHI